MTTKIIVKAEHNCGPYGKVLVGVADKGHVSSVLLSPGDSAEYSVWDHRRIFVREATKLDIDDHSV